MPLLPDNNPSPDVHMAPYSLWSRPPETGHYINNGLFLCSVIQCIWVSVDIVLLYLGECGYWFVIYGLVWILFCYIWVSVDIVLLYLG